MVRTRQTKGQDTSSARETAPSERKRGPAQTAVPSDLTNPSGPPYAMSRSPGDQMVPDKADQEFDQARDTLAQQAEHQLELNEGGRSHDSSHKHNPPGAVHGVPAPSLHGTWR